MLIIRSDKRLDILGPSQFLMVTPGDICCNSAMVH